MIASLEGLVESKDLGQTVINIHGVGYEVFISDATSSSLEQGKSAKLFIHEQIKEDVHDLYGFLNRNEKQLFESLLSVKNVGPKVAISVLNIGSAASVREAIAGGDAKQLQSAKGVGRRAAEQIIVELRDKVGLISTNEAEAIVGRSGEGDGDEAVEALVSLGFNPYDAKAALSKVDRDLPLEDRIKLALRTGK